MKRYFTSFVLFAAIVLGSLSGFAQEVDYQELYNTSKKTALVISEKLDLSEEETQYLTRFITSREQSMVKLGPNNSEDASHAKHIEKLNRSFKKNAISIFGEEKTKEILILYPLQD